VSGEREELPGVDRDQEQPGQKSGHGEEQKNRPHAPVPFTGPERQGAASAARPPDRKSVTGMIEKERHHSHVKDAVQQLQVCYQLPIYQWKLHAPPTLIQSLR
jgi:hypothetical protein